MAQPPFPSTPISGGRLPTGVDPNSWTLWWNHNREAYFDTIAWTRNVSNPFFTSSARRVVALDESAIHEEIVPALLEVLKHDPTAELQRGVLLSLAKIGHRQDGQLGGSELQDLLLAHLTDPNQLVAETACIALGVLDRPGVLPILASLLQDAEAGQKLLKKERVPHRMRAYAAYGIALLGQRTEMADVRRFASHVLVQALQEDCGATPDMHVAAVIGLGLVGSGKQHIEVLLELLANKREHAQARAHAPAALAKLALDAPPQSRQLVVATLSDFAQRRSEKAPIQEGSLLALGQLLSCGPQDAAQRAELIKIAKGGKSQERGWAMIALAQIASRPEPTAADPLAGSFDIQNLLLKSLSRSSHTLEPWIALSLGVLAHGLRTQGESVPASLGRALSDGLKSTNSPENALAFGIGLGLARAPKGLESLTDKLSKFDVNTRSLLSTAIGLQGDPAAQSALLEELHEARHAPGTLISSAHALALLNDTSVVAELVRMFEACDCLLSAAGITQALARTRHPDAAAPLLKLLSDRGTTDAHRALAAVALGNLAEKEERPWSLRLSQGVNYRAPVATLTESDYGILLLP